MRGFEQRWTKKKRKKEIDMLGLQDNMKAQASQLQNHMAMNQQLMKRKEDMEWQLMSVLAQVHMPLVTFDPDSHPYKILWSQSHLVREHLSLLGRSLTAVSSPHDVACLIKTPGRRLHWCRLLLQLVSQP